jgi:hypothetical protein
MTCLTGGPTPSSAATGIPGRPATSSSPTCVACAAPTKASSGTPWSTALQTAAAQPGTARSTTRPAQCPPASPAFPTQDLRRRPDVKRSTAPLGAKWGATVSRHSAIQSPLECSITGIYQASSYSGRRQPTGRISFASKGSASEFLSTASLRLKLGSGFTDRCHT